MKNCQTSFCAHHNYRDLAKKTAFDETVMEKVLVVNKYFKQYSLYKSTAVAELVLKDALRMYSNKNNCKWISLKCTNING